MSSPVPTRLARWEADVAVWKNEIEAKFEKVAAELHISVTPEVTAAEAALSEAIDKSHAKSDLVNLYNQVVKIRPELASFAVQMETVLKANDFKDGWSASSLGDLMAVVHTKVAKIDALLAQDAQSIPESDLAVALKKEATDVANFCMMLVDNTKNLGSTTPDPKPEPTPEPAPTTADPPVEVQPGSAEASNTPPPMEPGVVA
jgi:hypothetical protein